MSRHRWGSLSWMIFGVLICIGAAGLSLGNLHNPGPGFLPFICGALLAGLAFISFLQEGRSEKPKAEEKPFIADRQRAWKATLTLLALLAYAIGMEYLGFLVSTVIFLAFLFWVVEPQRWYIVLGGSILAAGASYTIFEVLLQSPLPKGIFEFLG
jgi:putative tricarboxylic transport membrane protein